MAKPVPTITLQFKSPEAWGDEIFLYSWKVYGGQKTSLGKTFPGEIMTPLGKGWYRAQVTAEGSFGITFTDGSFRTEDLTPENGGWYSGRSWSLTPPADFFQTVTTSGHLKITEVGVHFDTGAPTWLEIQNIHPTETAQLGTYSLRAQSVSRDDPYYVYPEPELFSLPLLEIPPRGYVLIMGKAYQDLPSGPQVAMVLKDGHLTPYWWDSGLVELVREGTTVDCLLIGKATPRPLDPSAWEGLGATNPFEAHSREQLAGWSYTRDIGATDQNTLTDWKLTPWATPGGPGDVAMEALDQDNDGLPDTAEVPGGSFAGMPLYDWGARAGRPDIFIHVNYMDPEALPEIDEGITPRKEALEKVVQAFLHKGIGVHFDTGNLYGDGSFTLPQSTAGVVPQYKVPFALGMTIGRDITTMQNMAFLYTYKNKYLPLARRQVFHYLIFAYSQSNLGQAGSSGIAELRGNDFLVTLGGWDLTSRAGAGFSGEILSADENERMLINIQASTIMHELGHNLGLYHGGSKEENYKPNYLSIMNYSYQLSGLPSPGSGEAVRYYWTKYTHDGRRIDSPFARYFTMGSGFSYFSKIPDNETTLGFRMDYSDGTTPMLVETGLLEPQGLNLSESEPIDFNGSGEIDTEVLTTNTNNDFLLGTLEDHDDWKNLWLTFQRGIMGSRNGSTRASEEEKPWTFYMDHQAYITETLQPR